MRGGNESSNPTHEHKAFRDQDTRSQECPQAYCKAEVPCPQPGEGGNIQSSTTLGRTAGKIRDPPQGLGEADAGHG